MSGVHLAVEGAVKRYGRATALAGVDLIVHPGDRLGLVGESGSGKSTLGRLLLGLEHPEEGSVLVDGRELRSVLSTRSGRLGYRRRVQLVAQDTSSTFDPRHSVGDSIMVPARLLGGHDTAGARAAMEQVATELEIPLALLDRRPDQLSGGQRQRMAIARALVVRPELVVADEVVSALDVSVQGTVLNLLKRYCREHGAGLVFISHGLPATAFITERLVVLYHGVVAETGPTDQVLEHPQDPYTRSLVAAYAFSDADAV
ncbi:ABC transporter ATP-binding protein [Nocardioides bruguierae]|uniref:ATP-binding cassette domain-containing protein n=1 Tax=Nocardioides bruguierae TaxID=2945102 RepID=A0A9X2D6A1_9ACTN|nr:ATP-binding cassette domain-containing protein [Nocardioides bruguierae]MCM0620143.1 ATP-binding cassette domain-containing protein [Nocardioides bruguierae]